jgi:predicted nucleotidyltransferase component of viral defense system
MINIEQLLANYPENVQGYKRFILREYLQYQILDILFESQHAPKFSFLGGTALRLLHNNQRFSEDLDFDNFGLTADEFTQTANAIAKGLTTRGFDTEMRVLHKGAYHCYIRFPELLYNSQLSPLREEKILIQLDTESQGYSYQPERVFINKFEVFTQIYATPLPLLLAQKLFAILNRKRNKGRDFYDVVFILSKIDQPDYGFLELKTGINSPKELVSAITAHCNQLDMQAMANDVAPFLFTTADVKKVLLFADYFKTAVS